MWAFAAALPFLNTPFDLVEDAARFLERPDAFRRAVVRVRDREFEARVVLELEKRLLNVCWTAGVC